MERKVSVEELCSRREMKETAKKMRYPAAVCRRKQADVCSGSFLRRWVDIPRIDAGNFLGSGRCNKFIVDEESGGEAELDAVGGLELNAVSHGGYR